MTMRSTAPLAMAWALVAFACTDGGEGPTGDAGPGADAGSPDAAVADAGRPDAGPGDAGAGDGDAGPADAGAGDSDAGPADAGGDVDAGPADGGGVAECDKPANAGRREALLASQPTIGVRSRRQITSAVAFASLADDPSATCAVNLQFKDSNGNGALDPYEDWTKTADERAADLLGRMSVDQKTGLMAHATLTDVPTSSNSSPSAATQAAIAAHVRFGRTAANSAVLIYRATWANKIQEACEAADLGIPFLLSTEPAHVPGNGRTVAKGFSRWPAEPGLAATADPAMIEQFARTAAKEYRAIGIRMALSPSADLATEPRWFHGQFTFGESSADVSAVVAAYVKGLQGGTTLQRNGVASVAGQFPGAGAAKDGFDARLQKGKYLAYQGTNLDLHLAPFARAVATGVAGIMPAYGVPQTGAWSALGGLVNGSTLEQVGVAYNRTLVTDVLRGHYGYDGLVLVPWGVLENAGTSPLGTPWGMEAKTKAERVAKAVNAGADQFGGLNDVVAVAAARAAGSITQAQIDAAARRALRVMFQVGLFEDPYVEPTQASAICNTDEAYRSGLSVLYRSMVLLVNKPKPAGWLNGAGDGTQAGDKGNAGNGSGLVLPAPPGQAYVAAGCRYYVGGNFDLDYVASVATGYGELTNDAPVINGQPAPTAADRMALSDYIIIRVGSPCAADPDSGPLGQCTGSLEYGGSGASGLLADLAAARAAIDSHPGSRAQIIVGVDAGRAPVLSEILAYNPSGVYLEWLGTGPSNVVDKVFLDVMFGIVDGRGRLPMSLPLSDAAVAAQQCDVAGDGAHATFVRGHGIDTNAF